MDQRLDELDDEERQVSRKRPNTDRSRRRGDTSAERTSLLEWAVSGTGSLVKRVATFISDKYERLKDYVW